MEFIKAGAFATVLGFGFVVSINGADKKQSSGSLSDFNDTASTRRRFVSNFDSLYKQDSLNSSSVPAKLYGSFYYNYPGIVPKNFNCNHVVLTKTPIDNTLYISGMLAYVDGTKTLIDDPVQATHQIMSHIAFILGEHYMNFGNVVDVILFVKNINNLQVINTVYASYFQGLPIPSFTALAVADLPLGASVEIKVTAREIFS